MGHYWRSPNDSALDRAYTAAADDCCGISGALSITVFGTLIVQRESFLSGLQLSLVIAAVLLITTASASMRLLHARQGASA